METPNNDGRVLRDLALIYLALAHSTDEHLNDQEIETISDRLREWQDFDSQTVLSAIKQALEEYVREDADVRVRNAVRDVVQFVPLDQRKAIVDDLMEIAMADGKFLHKEGSFIGELSRSWGIHPEGDHSEEHLSWSLLNRDQQEGNWTPTHDLALVYLTLAQSTDGDLESEEVEAITDKLCEWLPDARRDEVVELVREVLSVYVQGPDQRLFVEAVESVSRSVPEHQRVALLDDLRCVAEADGVLIDEEREMIGKLARHWGVPEAT